MARLTTRERHRLPDADFALPKQRKYPDEDRRHGADAKSRASAAEHAGRITPATERKIDRAVDRKFPSMGKRGK